MAEKRTGSEEEKAGGTEQRRVLGAEEARQGRTVLGPWGRRIWILSFVIMLILVVLLLF